MDAAEVNPFFDHEVERNVLYALLLRPEQVLPVALRHIQPSDFHFKGHERIYRACLELSEANVPIEYASVYYKLKEKQPDFDRNDLNKIVNGFAANGAEEWLLEKISNFSRRRKLWEHSEELRTVTEDPTRSVEDLVRQAESRIQSIVRTAAPAQAQTIGDIANDVMNKLFQRADRSEEIQGMPSGYAELDALTTGFHAGDLIVLAARPSMGKTQFVCNLILNAVEHRDARTLVVSLEMSKEAITERLIVLKAGMSSLAVRQGQIGTPEWAKLGEAVDWLTKSKLTVIDTTDEVLTVADMENCIKIMDARGEKPEYVIIDYLSYIRGSSETMNRNLEIEQIVRDLHDLAIKQQIPIIVLSQLNREVGKRNDKRPQLHDLRESGGIEQAADLVLFIHREAYYDKNLETDKRTTELIIAKQRNGPLGTIYLEFDDMCGEFLPLGQGYEPSYRKNFVVGGAKKKKTAGEGKDLAAKNDE